MRFIQKVAKDRIEKLLTMAENVHRKDPNLARRYVELALKVARKNRVRIPKKWKYMFCKKCFSWWVPGENVIIRLKPRPKPHILYVCKTCGHIYRRGYDKQTSRD